MMEQFSTDQAISFALNNFGLVMFAVAAFFMLINRVVAGGKLTQYEIVYRWTALFALGFTGIYCFVMHGFYPAMTAAKIGWLASPFQYEVAMANLGFGLMGVFSFNASYGFRLATVVGSTFWLWGDAANHLYQIVQFQNYTDGNAGTWLWMDILVPFLLIICIRKLKPTKSS